MVPPTDDGALSVGGGETDFGGRADMVLLLVVVKGGVGRCWWRVEGKEGRAGRPSSSCSVFFVVVVVYIYICLYT